MSDNILKLIPSSPMYTPQEDAAQRVIDIVHTLFPFAGSVNIKRSDKPQFVDPGSNFERVICTQCGAAIDQTWWQRVMDKASENKFTDLSIVVPCCDSKTSLNKLRYEWPAGFAQFIIEIINPGRNISDEELLKIETILSSKLRKIWSHY
jgi:hypothetical protein